MMAKRNVTTKNISKNKSVLVVGRVETQSFFTLVGVQNQPINGCFKGL